MNWTEPAKAQLDVSNYDHIMCETPLGRAMIEWKSWKERDSYSLTIGGEYINEGYTLDEAKRIARSWLEAKRNELTEFLNP